MTANTTPMSMVNPSTDALMKKIDSRYSLVVLAAKRARQILAKSPIRSTKERSIKDVTNALEEILEGKIRYIPGIVEQNDEETSVLQAGENGEGDYLEYPATTKNSSAHDEYARNSSAGRTNADNKKTVSAAVNANDYEATADIADDYSDFVIDAKKRVR